MSIEINHVIVGLTRCMKDVFVLLVMTKNQHFKNNLKRMNCFNTESKFVSPHNRNVQSNKRVILERFCKHFPVQKQA